MRVAYLQIQNFRGISSLEWAPSGGINCLVGPGDSTKTTVLDAIELALNPRYAYIGDDVDFFEMDTESELSIMVTLVDLPPEIIEDQRYGMYLRGWDALQKKIQDDPGYPLQDALTIHFSIDKNSLEGVWQVYKSVLPEEDKEPPQVRLKHAAIFSATRLGPYADRHLSWGKNTVLTKLGKKSESLNSHLAMASRAARSAFGKESGKLFEDATKRAQELSTAFGVRVRAKFTAELDVEGASLTSGGITLHDQKLPVRTLGTGSSRLLVAGLQQGATGSRISLIDELEHGLEPHRIARLIVHMRTSVDRTQEGSEDTREPEKLPAPQIFTTTHSPVVIRELTATEVFTVRRPADGKVRIAPIGTTPRIQAYLRTSPEAFMARRLLIGEGKTEVGFFRGLDRMWVDSEKYSFAIQGIVSVSGGGSSTLPFAIHMRSLGFEAYVLLDSDIKKGQTAHKQAQISEAIKQGCQVEIWENLCAIEHRIFFDVPWGCVKELVKFAVGQNETGEEGMRDCLNNAMQKAGLAQLKNLELPDAADTVSFRKVIGDVAGEKSWFKDIYEGEKLAEIIFPHIEQFSNTSLGKKIASMRAWIDG